MQTYGGGLWHTWFDRPLGLAGKVVIKNNNKDLMSEELIHIPEPVMVIPNLAIHLTSADERKAFSPNTETNLQPVLCMAPAKEEDDKTSTTCVPADSDVRESKKKNLGLGNLNHDPHLLKLIAEKIPGGNCKPEDIVDLDLCLFDAEPSRLIGLNEDFIYSGRIDNLVSVFAQTAGIIEFANDDGKVSNCADIAVSCAFDHEEVGSESTVGADSRNLESWLKQILGEFIDKYNNMSNNQNTCIPFQNTYMRVVANSIFFSIDGAHGFHPNYPAKHQSEHRPQLHEGIVIKTNANQRYATTPLTAALFRKVCEKKLVKVQDFVVRNDSPCGSTIGPMVSSKLGMRSIDVGIAQWAMHSCKETCSSLDLDYLKSFCSGSFEVFREVDEGCSKI